MQSLHRKAYSLANRDYLRRRIDHLSKATNIPAENSLSEQTGDKCDY